jgi:type I restriction enzyme M protein
MFEQTFKNIDDVLWKEAGCTTELDYTEQTSWILFLKYLDDLEQGRAMEAELVGKPYTFIIDADHKWSKWAAPKKADGTFDHDNALTGDDLIDYVNRKLFPYLQGFKQRATSPDTIEYKIGEIFSEIKNRFQSGYSLRDALELIDELRFQSQKEKHELSHLYEAKIKNMGNAGRNGGEYYTPRPLIRAMIQVTKPKLGERIYDGALGSGGFLCEAYEYLRQGELTTSQLKTLQTRTFYGKEYDPARHRCAEHRPYQHACREPSRRSGKRPLRRNPCQPAFWRQGAAGGAAKFPYQNRGNGLPFSTAFYQAPESGRPSGHRHQKHIFVQLGRGSAGTAPGVA